MKFPKKEDARPAAQNKTSDLTKIKILRYAKPGKRCPHWVFVLRIQCDTIVHVLRFEIMRFALLREQELHREGS